MSEYNNDQDSKFEEILNSTLVIIAVPFFTIGAAFIAYFGWFYVINDQKLATSAAAWGTFGDFIGGTANPILGVTTLFFIAVTYLGQRKEYIRAAQVAEAEHKISLFDKRIKIFIEFEDLFGAFIRDGKPKPEAVQRLRVGARHARFLFPQAVEQFLDEIVRKAGIHHVANAEWEPLRERAFNHEHLTDGERERLGSSLQTMHEIEDWFLQQVTDGRVVREFEPFLKLHMT